MEESCVFPDHGEPVTNCLNGSVKFKGSSILDEQRFNMTRDKKFRPAV